MSELDPLLQSAAVTGNGRMLACLSSQGLLTKLFWPHIDYGQHMGKFYAGLLLRDDSGHGQTRWLHQEGWHTEQHYLPSGTVIHTVYRDDYRLFVLEQWSFVLPDTDILINRYLIKNTGGDTIAPVFMLYFSFLPNESDQYDSMYIDFDAFAAVQYRRHVYLAVGALEDLTPYGYHCGRIDTPSDPLEQISCGQFQANQINLGRSAGSLGWETGPIKQGGFTFVTTYLAAGQNSDQVMEKIRGLKSKGPEEWLPETQRYWRGWVKEGYWPNAKADEDTRPAALYRRSLLTVRLLQDDSGALIAAPEFDPRYRLSGGYGYCWMRDALYSAMALDEAGYRKEAEKFYLFAISTQTSWGDWQQRYFTDGSWAPGWGRQIDQTGSILWGFLHHHRLSKNADFIALVWPAIQKAADYLTANLADNNLPQPSIDPWEERLSQGTYSAAAVYAGLRAAALMARELGDPEQAGRWQTAADKIRLAIISLQWNPSLNCFYRGVSKRIDEGEYHYLRDQGFKVWTAKDPSGIYTTFWREADDNIDSATLALGFPFNVLPPGDKKLTAAAQVIESTLWNHRVGGLHRYAGDTYAGGNPWIITTLWLALHLFREGNRKHAKEMLSWCVDNANHNRLLPEQVHKENGGPAWVVPLKWSHAMYTLTFLALHGRAAWLDLE
ncbi:MAG: glycoside hydrolase family 15 protein [Firmicutes bacterium]|nr:glycoside hydrolase family 15 protein [Bacillota bacterium]